MKDSLKPQSVKQIALQRISVLFSEADAVGKTSPELAAAYVRSAQRVAMAARFPLPKEYKRRICKGCGAFLVEGFNVRTRLQQKREPHLVVRCLNCGCNSRIMLKKKERVEVE